MRAYRKPSGVHIVVDNSTPVSDRLTEIALPPSEDHVTSDNWFTDPMNPVVCWRLKTQAEKNTEAREQFKKELGTNKVVRALITRIATKEGVSPSMVVNELGSVYVSLLK